MSEISSRKTLAALMVTFLAAACAQPPTQEIASAEQSVQAAVSAGANEYASGPLQEAQTALANAKTQLDAKAYKDAKMSALEAKGKADLAVGAIESGKAQVKAEVEQLMMTLKADADAVSAEIKKMKGKAATALKDEVKQINALKGAAESDLNQSLFAPAKMKLQEGEAKLAEIKAKIAEAMKAPAKPAVPMKKAKTKTNKHKK